MPWGTYGRGRGGRGGGRGFGNPYPYCRNFPWLSRRWWRFGGLPCGRGYGPRAMYPRVGGYYPYAAYPQRPYGRPRSW